MSDPCFDETIETLKGFSEIDAIALGGSKASGKDDAYSDYDIYVYLNSALDTEKRKAMLGKTCSYMEINNTYWETEDDCILNNGMYFEVIYRTIEDTCQSLRDTLVNHSARCGYTTCICYNVFNSKTLYDPANLFRGMVEEYTMPYPEALRRNIIAKNRELLQGKIPSYLRQVEKAVKRNDIVSVNHRLSELLASYFDILYAFNRKFHPGEKRLIDLTIDSCELLPKDFGAVLSELLHGNRDEIVLVIHKLVSNLDDLLGSAA